MSTKLIKFAVVFGKSQKCQLSFAVTRSIVQIVEPKR